MAKKNYSKIKYEEKILNSLNSFLRSEIRDSRLKFVTITKVELAPDYGAALVYWDTYDLEKKDAIESTIEGIENGARNYLSKVLDVRHVPKISFKFDSQYVDEMKISKLLQEENED